MCTQNLTQASYALGYNLAVEYLAAYEKTWLLESFQTLNRNVLAAQGKAVDWLFLEVHAIGEPEHAELGHDAVAALVPASHTDVLRECAPLASFRTPHPLIVPSRANGLLAASLNTYSVALGSAECSLAASR
jgi:hypothetical protein